MPSPGLTAAQRAVTAHLADCFEGHEVSVRECSVGPVEEHVPGFRVACVSPGPKLAQWAYVSLGCWDAQHDGEHGLEFVLVGGSADDPRHDLSLAMTAYYHCTPDPSFRLDLGHTIPMGEPWLPGSTCDHVLVSLPYPFGPDFEVCEWEAGHARVLWLLPITEAERDFKAEHGLEALEQRFDDAAIEYWDPARASVA